MIEKKRAPTVAMNLLARPGNAPARSTPVEDLPRPRPEPTVVAPSPEPTAKQTGGIKAATIGTTVYLLPAEHKRVRRLALDLDVPSVHELLLLGLDRLLAKRGEPAIKRYSPPRPQKG